MENNYLAPNGKKSNLTDSQYKLVRTKAFKDWFGDWENDSANASKVVDENGEPLVMYSGSPRQFTIFESDEILVDKDDKEFKPRFWFTIDKEYADSLASKTFGTPTIYICFLNIRNPKYDDFNLYVDEFYDGSIQYNRKNINVVTAFNPNQIKLADGSNTTFDSNNNDIRFDGGGSISRPKNVQIKIFNEQETYFLSRKKYNNVWEFTKTSISKNQKEEGTNNIFFYKTYDAMLNSAKKMANDKSTIRIWDETEKSKDYLLKDYLLKDDSNNNDIRFDGGGWVEKPKKIKEDVYKFQDKNGVGYIVKRLIGANPNKKWIVSNSIDGEYDGSHNPFSTKKEAINYIESFFNKEEYKKGGMTNKGYVSYKDKYNTKYGYKNGESHDLEQIAKDTGVSIKGLQQIYNKGIGAYKTNPQSVRPNVKSKEQWAMARVYSSVMGGKASKIDSNELKMNLGGNVHIGESIEFYERTYADGTKERFSIEDYEKNIYPLLEKDFSRFVNGGGVGKMNYADGRKFRIRVKQKKG